MTDRPQLGHYVVACKLPEPREVHVVPDNGKDGLIRLWVKGSSFALAAGLSAREARKIAQGLLVCAERMDYPHAVAGPGAYADD